MPKRLILHVGPHKTGSTYLQKRLALHARDLARRGVTYPVQARNNLGHGAIVNYLRGWQRHTEGMTEATFAEIAEYETVVLSSENFVLLETEALQSLRRRFPDHEISVVFVLRSLTSVLPSHWQETVKHGNDNTFLTYLARASGWISGDLSHVLPSRQLPRFATLFGRDSLRVISYDHAVADGADVFDVFAEHGLGVELARERGAGQVVNPFFPPARIELLRTLAETHRRQHPKGPGPNIRLAYMACYREIEGTEEFRAFSRAFGAVSFDVTIKESDPLLQSDAATVLEDFGDRIANLPAGSDMLHDPDLASITRSAPPNWAAAAGQSEYVDTLLAKLLG